LWRSAIYHEKYLLLGITYMQTYVTTEFFLCVNKSTFYQLIFFYCYTQGRMGALRVLKDGGAPRVLGAPRLLGALRACRALRACWGRSARVGRSALVGGAPRMLCLS